MDKDKKRHNELTEERVREIVREEIEAYYSRLSCQAEQELPSVLKFPDWPRPTKPAPLDENGRSLCGD